MLAHQVFSSRDLCTFFILIFCFFSLVLSNLVATCCQRQSRTGECRDPQELATAICSVHRFDSPSSALVQSAFFQTVPGHRRSFTSRDIIRCRFYARAGTSALPIAFGVGGSDGCF